LGVLRDRQQLRQLDQYPNDPLVASWVLSELFAKENPNYKMSPSAFLALTDKYRLPGSCMRPVHADLPATSEQTVDYAKAAREIFTKAQQENRQRKLNT